MKTNDSKASKRFAKSLKIALEQYRKDMLSENIKRGLALKKQKELESIKKI